MMCVCHLGTVKSIVHFIVCHRDGVCEPIRHYARVVMLFLIATLSTIGHSSVITVVTVGRSTVRLLCRLIGKVVVVPDSFQYGGIVLVESWFHRRRSVEPNAGRQPQRRRPERQDLETVDGRSDVRLIQELISFVLCLGLFFKVTIVPTGFFVLNDLGL
jgi:hypothetical protein